MGTCVKRHSSGGNDLHKKFTFIPGIEINGFSVYEVVEAVKYAKEYSLTKGPIFINCNTYWYHGHSMSDPGITYRNKKEIQDIRENKDPIMLLKNLIIDNNILSEDQIA